MAVQVDMQSTWSKIKRSVIPQQTTFDIGQLAAVVRSSLQILRTLTLGKEKGWIGKQQMTLLNATYPLNGIL